MTNYATSMSDPSSRRKHSFAWICLVLSGCLEVVWAYTMKLSHGFSDPLYTVITIVILAANLFLLEKPVAVLGIGVSYGVFTGLGIVGTTIAGAVSLGETLDPIKIVSIAILMIGVIGLKFCDAKEAAQKAAKMIEQYNSQTIQHATSPQEGALYIALYAHYEQFPKFTRS